MQLSCTKSPSRSRDVHSTFTGWEEGADKKIEPVLKKFAEYCEPRRNVPFERYRFDQRHMTYNTSSLRKLAEGCDFDKITPDEILRDRLVIGILDGQVRETLAREAHLTLAKTDEICRAAESMRAQLKVVDEIGGPDEGETTKSHHVAERNNNAEVKSALSTSGKSRIVSGSGKGMPFLGKEESLCVSPRGESCGQMWSGQGGNVSDR